MYVGMYVCMYLKFIHVDKLVPDLERILEKHKPCRTPPPHAYNVPKNHTLRTSKLVLKHTMPRRSLTLRTSSIHVPKKSLTHLYI